MSIFFYLEMGAYICFNTIIY